METKSCLDCPLIACRAMGCQYPNSCELDYEPEVEEDLPETDLLLICSVGESFDECQVVDEALGRKLDWQENYWSRLRVGDVLICRYDTYLSPADHATALEVLGWE